MLPASTKTSERNGSSAAEKYMPQLQHNMWVTHLRTSVLSITTGGGKWVEIAIPMDPLYLSVLVSAEKKFWRCVQSGEVPHLTGDQHGHTTGSLLADRP